MVGEGKRKKGPHECIFNFLMSRLRSKVILQDDVLYVKPKNWSEISRSTIVDLSIEGYNVETDYVFSLVPPVPDYTMGGEKRFTL